MGCLISRDEKAANVRSKEIDLKLRTEAETISQQVKLLLLGKYFKLVNKIS